MGATREDKDLKQSDAAEMLNIKQQQYSEYEEVFRLMPITYSFEFCRCMNISSDYILGLPDDLSHPKR